jgi:hypothetical protein
MRCWIITSTIWSQLNILTCTLHVPDSNYKVTSPRVAPLTLCEHSLWVLLAWRRPLLVLLLLLVLLGLAVM